MNDEAEQYNIAVRYRRVKKHLDNLGYKQALSLDALPLIENLLADLIQTTDSLKHFKTIAQENIEVRINVLHELVRNEENSSSKKKDFSSVY